MSERSPVTTRIIWAFWLAAVLVAIGGAVPLLLAGPSGRISLVIIPFWIAAIALGACALLHHRGRAVPTLLYSIAGFAVVYGILAVLAVPLRLAVIGTCPPAPAQCPAGYLQPLTEGESTGLGFAIGMGIIGVFVGFFGLVIVFRQLRSPGGRSAATTFAPPVRRIPPVRTSPPSEEPAPEKSPAPAAEGADHPAVQPVEAAPEPLAELPAPEEEPELPAHLSDDAAEGDERNSPPSTN